MAGSAFPNQAALIPQPVDEGAAEATDAVFRAPIETSSYLGALLIDGIGSSSARQALEHFHIEWR